MTSPEIEKVEEANDEQLNEQHEQQHDEQEKKEVVNKPDYSTKTVKKLTADERAMLMSKFEKHEEDPYFKVMMMSNGGIRITKRKIPLNTDIKEVQKIRASAIENKYKGRLTNEQLIMEHIFDLETRFEAMRLKHKKLKKRYNELESQIYENVDDEEKPVDEKPVDEKPDEPEPEKENLNVRIENEAQGAENEVLEQQTHEQQPEQTQQQPLRRKKASWRDYISYM